MKTNRLLAAAFLSLGLVMACRWLLGARLATAAPVTVFEVTKLADTNDGLCNTDCSLREAIRAANANPGADVISLTVVGTYTLSITGTNESAAATGDLDISEDLTILGQGTSATIIDAEGIDRVFHLSAAGTVVISGVTIMGGRPPAGGGGGITINDSDLSLFNVAVISNSGYLYGGAGGGIRIQGTDAAFTMDESSILARNRAYGGGGLAVVDGARVTLSAGQIVSNTGDPHGGGVSVSAATFTQTGSCTIAHNTASYGGGLYIHQGQVALDGGQIVSNTATSYGGGVYVQNTNAILTQSDDSIIAGNTAVRGGGVHINYGQAALGGGQIHDNTAAWGGGLCIQGSGSATLSGGEILSNTAYEYGGGVMLLASDAIFTQTGGLIAHNGVTGTGIWDGGGGAYIANGRASLNGGQILHNQALRGGGLHVSYSSVVLDGVLIADNVADEGAGTYIYTGTLTLHSGQIAHNNANGYGGGMYARGGFILADGGQIIDNGAEEGGGVYVVGGSWPGVVIEGVRFISNTATNGGGGIHVASNIVTVQRAQIIGNFAAHGGGVYHAGGSLALINTTVSSNTATLGGGIYDASGSASPMVLTHTTVASNTTAGDYGIHIVAGSAIQAKNSVIAYNSPANCGGAGDVTSNDHNLDDDGTCALGQANDKSGFDPQLAPLALDRDTLVHAIAPGSPAHDAGECLAGITTDQRGLPRLAPCDMGAYEYGLQAYLPLVLRSY
jgi:CSLREA domain-containing protein